MKQKNKGSVDPRDLYATNSPKACGPGVVKENSYTERPREAIPDSEIFEAEDDANTPKGASDLFTAQGIL